MRLLCMMVMVSCSVCVGVGVVGHMMLPLERSYVPPLLLPVRQGLSSCDVECFGLEPVYVVEVDVFSAGTSFVCPCGSVCLLRGCGCSPDALDSSVV